MVVRPEYPLIATDCVIEYDRLGYKGIVLIERKNYPYGIALPGGMLEYGLTAEENMKKEAEEETGLSIKLISPDKPLIVCSDPYRDPRAHVISLAYVAEGYGVLHSGSDAKDAFIEPISGLQRLLDDDKLVLGHGLIIDAYLRWKGYR